MRQPGGMWECMGCRWRGAGGLASLYATFAIFIALVLTLYRTTSCMPIDSPLSIIQSCFPQRHSPQIARRRGRSPGVLVRLPPQNEVFNPGGAA